MQTKSYQAYSEQNGAGYVGSLGTNFEKHDGGDMYEIGWWAEYNQPIEYKFRLEPGEYNLFTGYQEWWNTTLQMRITVTNSTGNRLAQKDFTLPNWDKAMVQELNFTLNEPNTVSVKIAKTGIADPVLSFIEIVKNNQADKQIVSIADIEDKKVQLGTEVSKLDLPKTITTNLNNNTTAEVPVAWNTKSYDGNKVGEYTLNGTLQPQLGIFNSANLTAKITAIVAEENVPAPASEVALPTLIASAKEKAAYSKYTQASRDALTKAIEAAQAVADKDKATEQESADARLLL